MPILTKKSKLMKLFHEEVQNLVIDMRSDLSALDKNHSAVILHRLFRSAHTIKSSSGAVGFSGLNEISQALEIIFKAAHDEKIPVNRKLIRLLSESVEVCRKLGRKETADNYEVLLGQLYTICQSV